MIGFSKLQVSEIEFNRLLRKYKAIDNWQAIGNSNVWFGPDGEALAMCVYDNKSTTCQYYFLNKYLTTV